VPTQVIWGTADAIVPAAHADGLPASIPVHRFDGKGHMVHMEAAAEVNRLIEDFIQDR
jgi:pyruvate dehydrogenase E2 component (dihydrolipoamide acetyltransferase)